MYVEAPLVSLSGEAISNESNPLALVCMMQGLGPTGERQMYVGAVSVHSRMQWIVC